MMNHNPIQPLSLRISVTDRCQLRCLYCMPHGGVPKISHEDVLSFEEILHFVRAVKSHFGLSKVRVTGGEPLVRKGIVNLIRMLKQEHISDIALTTNGQKLAEMADDLKHAGLGRINVSLDSLNPKTFRMLTYGGELRRTLLGIEAARRCGLTPVKINTVVMKGYNDNEVVELVNFALDTGCQIRFLELMPIACAQTMFCDRFVPTSEVRDKLEKFFTLQSIVCERGQTSRDFSVCDRHCRRGIVGFISPQTRPFCSTCARLRLTSTGRLISCLARQDGPCIREFLNTDSYLTTETLIEVVEREFGRKLGRCTPTPLDSMAAIGG